MPPMSRSVFVAIAAIVLVYSLLVQAGCLWLAARFCRVAAVSFRRALALTVFIALLCLLLLAGFGLLCWLRGDVLAHDVTVMARWLRPTAWMALGLALASIVVPWLLIMVVFKASWWRAGLAMLVASLLGQLLAWPVAAALRAKVAEAFVVPTGAMAPTIIGAHVDLTCANCRWEFAYTMSGQMHEEIPEDETTLCTNCGHLCPVPADIRPWSGDRVLLSKIDRPGRWELTVFPLPDDPSTNFVKRLVGLPGESVVLLGGDVFIDGRRLHKGPAVFSDLWLPVHDTRYVPAQPLPGGPHWEPVAANQAWRCAAGRWSFVGKGQTAESLFFSGLITDRLAYNVREHGLPAGPGFPVGDVKVESTLSAFSGEGAMGYSWQFGRRRVNATIGASGQVELTVFGAPLQEVKSLARERARGHLSAKLSSGHRLALVVRDGQAYVLEADTVVTSVPVGPQDLESVLAESDPAVAPCRLEICARGCSLSFSHIVVHKDVYYRSGDQMPMVQLRREPVRLGPDECMVLGDNSSHSKDSRVFGPVRYATLLGVVRWIYWPPTRWHEFPLASRQTQAQP